MSNLPKGEFKNSSNSPDNKYTINMYLCDGGATVDYSVRGELVDKIKKKTKNIYWDYHQEDTKVKWINNNTVMINDKVLNVEKDVYDFRDE